MDTRICRKGLMRALLPAVLAAGLATGCGGGGGGDDGGGGGGLPGLVTVPTSLVNIDRNMAVNLVNSLGMVSDNASPSSPGLSSAGAASGGTVRPAFSPGGTTSCPGGGSVTVTHPGGDPTTGPEVTTFNNCTDALGNVTTGQIILNAADTTGVSAEWNMFKIAFAGAGYLLLHGDISSTIQSAPPLTTVSSTIKSLQIQSQFPGEPVAAFLVTNATTTTVTDSNAMTYTTSYTYTLASNLWNGAVQVATVMDLVTNFGDPFPSSGQVKITGANGTQALVTFNGDQTVRVQIDEDGDGNFDFDQTYTWAELGG